MKKTCIVLALVLAALLMATPALAAYSINIDITESLGNSYQMLPVAVDMDIEYLADHGFISKNGTDVRIKGSTGQELPFMLAEDRLLVASPIGANRVTRAYLTTGNTPLESFSVVTGNGGNITIADNAALELGDNFEIEFEGWVPSSGTLISKGDPIVSSGSGYLNVFLPGSKCYEATSGSVFWPVYGGRRHGERINGVPQGYISKASFRLKRYGSPTGTAYVRVRKVSDDSIVGTLGSIDVSTISTTSQWYLFSELVYNPTTQDLRICFEFAGGDSNNYISVGATDSNVVPNAVRTEYSGTSWFDYASTDVRAIIYCGNVTLSTAVEEKENKIKITCDGSSSKLYLNGVEKDSDVPASAPDTSHNWVISVTYFNYYKHTTSGVLRITYQPDDIIQGTTLPNKLNPGTYDGTITWGANPNGISVQTSRLTPTETYEFIDTEAGGEDIIAPEPARLISGVDLDRLERNPFYPLAKAISDASRGRLPIELVWILGAWFVTIAAFIGCFVLMREHILIAGLVGEGLAILFYTMGIFDYWVLIVFGLGIIAGIVQERMPTW